MFRGIPIGTQALTDLLLSRLVAAGVEVHRSCPVQALERGAGGGWTVQTPVGPIDADAVIVTTPAFVAAGLLAPHAPLAAEGLAEVEYASVAMVTMAVRRESLGRELDASGFLVAGGEALDALTACRGPRPSGPTSPIPTWPCCGSRPVGTVMPQPSSSTTATSSGCWATTSGGPWGWRGRRWSPASRAGPTPSRSPPGHLGRLRAWRQELTEEAPGLLLAGAACDGLGLPACVRQGRRVAAQAAGAGPAAP